MGLLLSLHWFFCQKFLRLYNFYAWFIIIKETTFGFHHIDFSWLWPSTIMIIPWKQPNSCQEMFKCNKEYIQAIIAIIFTVNGINWLFNRPGQIQSPFGILARTLTRPYLMAACDVTFPDIMGGRISCPNDVLSHPQFTPFVQVPHKPCNTIDRNIRVYNKTNSIYHYHYHNKS